MDYNLILIVYLCVASVTAFATGLWLATGEEVGDIENFWDFIIYCLLWGVLPIKAIIKYVKNIFTS